MSRASHDDSSGSRAARFLTAMAVIAGLGLSVVVSVWALAHPDNDPVTDNARQAWTAIQDRMAWARPGPAGGGLDLEAASMAIPGAEPAIGRVLIGEYGCGSCHTIPGVSNANGSVGPNFNDFSNRAYIAGILPNRPGDLTSWLMQPTVHAPKTAMPDLGITEDEARHMAAYLYTLGDVR